jgi:molecular chaperone DnaK (HSP70)
LDAVGMVHFVVGPPNNLTTVKPEEIGAHLLRTLRQTAVANLSSDVTKTVMSVPAEFVDMQKNFTKKAASLAGEYLNELKLLVHFKNTVE